MESSHLGTFSTSGKFITQFNVLRCINLSETLFWTGVRGGIPITLIIQSKVWPKAAVLVIWLTRCLRSAS